MAVCDQRVTVDYFRLSADRRLLFGGACHYSGRDPKDIGAYMRPKMVQVFPQLADVKIDYQWGGMIGIGANRLPQIGRLADQPNVYYAQAYAGHGLNATHLAGKLLGEAISGQQQGTFRSVRPGAAHHLPRRQALALAAVGAGDALAPVERTGVTQLRQNGFKPSWRACSAVNPISRSCSAVSSSSTLRVWRRCQNRLQRLRVGADIARACPPLPVPGRVTSAAHRSCRSFCRPHLLVAMSD
jgi:hypothetical protein